MENTFDDQTYKEIYIKMSTHDDFENEQKLIYYLSSQLILGRLTLLLGSGISKPFNLPDWKELISTLYSFQNETPPDGNELIQAEKYKIKHCKDNVACFKNDIHRALYNKFDHSLDALRKSDALAAIAALVMISSRGNISNIVTYNFDDILELYLEYHGFVTLSIKEPNYWADNSDVRIFHPHGFLPLRKELGFSRDIIFDQKSYSKIQSAQNHPWNQSILNILKTHTCLFIGLSGTDLHLDSLINAVNDDKIHHACVSENTLYWGITFSTDLENIAFWKDRKIFQKTITDYHYELPKFLFKICQKASTIKLREYLR